MIWKRETLDRSNVELEQALTEPVVPAARVARPAVPTPETKAAVGSPSISPTALAAGSTSPGKGSTLGATLRFKGDLIADEDLVIQGQVEGSILHTRSLTVGTQGRMQGDIRARRIVVQGTVDGDLYALENVTLQSGSTVRGDVFAPKVAIEEGARLSGRIDMDNAPTVPTVSLPSAGQPDAGEGVATPQEVDDVLSDSLTERPSKTA
jgi:cytoskeletal protein CcmA (bactofilin family)